MASLASRLSPNSVMSKNTNNRKESIQPTIKFNMPNLTLDSRNFTVKDQSVASDSEYSYNPRAIGHNMNSMLSKKQTIIGNNSGYIDYHNSSGISSRNFTAGNNRSLANNSRLT